MKPASESAFLAACRRESVAHRPIWIMRQAGRYLPEYRKLRSQVDFVELTRTAELAAEATLQPLRRYELDAGILFSDIMTPLQGMGIALEFEPGPIVRDPIRTDAQIDALRLRAALGQRAQAVDGPGMIHPERGESARLGLARRRADDLGCHACEDREALRHICRHCRLLSVWWARSYAAPALRSIAIRDTPERSCQPPRVRAS